MKTASSPIVLVIIRDCHARHNLVVTAHNEREERTYRRMATKQGYLVAVRKPKAHTELTKATVWRNPVAIAKRPRPQLGGAFNLALTETRKGGVA